MAFKIIIKPIVFLDLDEAINWYEHEQKGLAVRFYKSFETAIERIKKNPDAFANVLKIPNYDTQCGIKLFERKLALQLFARPFVSKWLFDIEIFIRTMEQTGMVDYTQNVKEVPLHEWREVAGSKLKLTDFIKAPIEIFRIYKAYFKKKIAD